MSKGRIVHFLQDDVKWSNSAVMLCGATPQTEGYYGYDRIDVALNPGCPYRDDFCRECLTVVHNVVLNERWGKEERELHKKYVEYKERVRALLRTAEPKWKKDYK